MASRLHPQRHDQLKKEFRKLNYIRKLIVSRLRWLDKQPYISSYEQRVQYLRKRKTDFCGRMVVLQLVLNGAGLTPWFDKQMGW